MFKVAALTATVLASAGAVTPQEVAKITTAMKSDTHKLAQQLKHPLQHDANLMASVKKLQLASKPASLQASSVLKTSRGVVGASAKASSVRSLRGKGGKGKGKGKDDDKDEDDEEEVVVVVDQPREYLQIRAGFCTGMDFGEGAVTEDVYEFSVQIANNVCTNAVNSDGFTFSFMQSFSLEPTPTWTHNSYGLHDCVAENVQFESEYPMDELTFEGEVAFDDVCTPTSEGYGMRLSVSQTSLTHSSGRAVLLIGESTSVNKCDAGKLGTDLSLFDFVEIEATGRLLAAGWEATCFNMEDDIDDDADADFVWPVGSYKYDMSQCGGEIPVYTRMEFSDLECTVSTGNEVTAAMGCLRDVEFPEDLLYSIDTCLPSA